LLNSVSFDFFSLQIYIFFFTWGIKKASFCITPYFIKAKTMILVLFITDFDSKLVFVRSDWS